MSKLIRNIISFFIIVAIIVVIFFTVGKRSKTPIHEDILDQVIADAQEAERLRVEQAFFEAEQRERELTQEKEDEQN